MTPADRLHFITELYVQGLLCDCNEWDGVVDDEEFVIGYEVRHHEKCKGRAKVMEILYEEANKI